MNDAASHPLRSNPVFWLIWLIPGVTVVAGLATLAIALSDADRALPASYHWEGEHLDADFASARNAAARGIAVSLAIRDGLCVAVVRNVAADSLRLELGLASSTDPGLDRTVLLQRTGEGDFRAPCTAVPAGRWWISVRDTAADWTVRGRVAGSLEDVELLARDPGATDS